MGVDFVGLANSTACDEFSDEGGHSWPPIVLLQKRDSADISAVGTSEGLVDAFYEGVSGRFGNVEARFVIKGTLVEVPVLGLRSR